MTAGVRETGNSPELDLPIHTLQYTCWWLKSLTVAFLSESLTVKLGCESGHVSQVDREQAVNPLHTSTQQTLYTCQVT